MRIFSVLNRKKRLINYSELDSNFFSPKASHTQLTHAIFANNLTWTIFACLKMRCFDCCWTKNQLSGYGLKLQLLHIGRLENCSLWNFKLPNFKFFLCFTMCNFSLEWWKIKAFKIHFLGLQNGKTYLKIGPLGRPALVSRKVWRPWCNFENFLSNCFIKLLMTLACRN